MTKKIKNIFYMLTVLLSLSVVTGCCECSNDKASKNKVSQEFQRQKLYI